jgi:hypothetical protein
VEAEFLENLSAAKQGVIHQTISVLWPNSCKLNAIDIP